MPSPNSLFSAFKPMITRFTSSAPNSAFRAADFQSQFQQAFRKQSKRWASDATAAGTGATAGGATGTGAAASQSFAQRMWNGPVGVKTVHFWAPVMKWSIVLAGASDFARPAESLSLSQNAALTCTGLIWTRWCFIIKPKNLLLAGVNFGLGCVGVIQCTRIFLYNSRVKGETPKEQLAEAKADVVHVAEGLKDEVKAAIQK